MRLHRHATCGKIDTGGRKVWPKAGHELAAKVSRHAYLLKQTSGTRASETHLLEANRRVECY